MFPIQFVPRACTTYLVQKKIEKATGIAIRSPWSGTLYILLVYGMLSHVSMHFPLFFSLRGYILLKYFWLSCCKMSFWLCIYDNQHTLFLLITFITSFLYNSLLTWMQFVGAFYYYMYATELLLCRGTIPKQELDQLLAKCANNDENKGVVSEAFANNIGSRSFTQKYMFCFSWGLKTLRYALWYDFMFIQL